MRRDPVILFVAKDSHYKELGLRCYDEDLDARTYAGDDPVVAHPPCQLWGKLARVNFKRYGGEHNRPGNDGGCFQFALDTVNRCGGVLEHPATSYAWEAHGLDKPQPCRWTPCSHGYVCEVWQSAYGHKANKRTWLYYVGKYPEHPRWDRPVGTHQVGWQDKAAGRQNKPTLSKREANATPPEFADYLIRLARTSIPRP